MIASDNESKTMKTVFDKDIKIRYSEMEYDLKLKPSALMQFLEDLASENAQELGFGYTFVRRNNLAWVLLKYRMEFDEYPQNLYDLKIKTEPRGYNRLFAFRDFGLYDGEKRFGRVASTWSLIDMDNRSLAPVSQFLSENKYMKPFEKRETDLAYEKLRPLNKVDIEKVYEVRYDDIDVNRHANNSNYVIWAFEPLRLDFRAEKRLKTLDMMFKKEIKYGDSVCSQVEFDGAKTNHVLKSVETGEDLCLISAQWT